MSACMKTLLIIITLVVLIIASTLVVGLYFTQQYILRDTKNQAAIISSIAEDLIASKLKLLKDSLGVIGEQLANLSEDEASPGSAEARIQGLLQTQVEHTGYRSLIMLDAEGKFISPQDVGLSPESLCNEYAQRAFQGERVITTTELKLEGELILRAWVPVFQGSRILLASLPGILLSDMVSRFRIWETGNIFIIDREGTIIANIHKEAVLKRQNFIEMAARDSAYQSVGDFTQLIIQGQAGEGIYTLGNLACVCSYLPIRGSEGWMLGVVAPVTENPITRVFSVLEISSLAVLGLGIAAAIAAVNRLAQSFEQIHGQNKHLIELTRIANSASEVKSRFLASMSHEVRTPMNAILGMSELIRTDNFDELQRHYFTDIRKMSGVLLETINDMLDFSKLEAGSLELVLDDYNVFELYNHICSVGMFMAASKNLEFKSNFGPAIPEVLYGDEIRVRQVLTNMVNNAIQHTQEGYVSFKVAAIRKDSGCYVSFIVEDTGTGIKQEDFLKLWDPFQPGNPIRDNRVNENRLGLSIAKRLMVLMGGEIQLVSEYGKGSVFTILLPLVEGDPLRLISSKAEEAEAAVQVMAAGEVRILVVDDNQLNLKVAEGFLSRRYITTDTVQSGGEAIEKVQENFYDLVFMDHMMPGIDGIETVKRIRSLGYTDIPIIALTANAISGARDFFLNSGMNDFLAKPIDSGELNRILRKWLPPEKIYPGDEEKPQPEHRDPPEGAVVDRKAGIHNAADDKTLYQQLLENFKTDHPSDDQQIRAALEAEDLPRAHQLAHTLKGAAALIGGLRLQNQALQIEKALVEGDLPRAWEALPGLTGELAAVLTELAQEIPLPEDTLDTGQVSGLDTPPAAGEPNPKYRILVVDDEKSNLLVLCRILSPEYTILTAKSGGEALHRAVKYQPDLILLDIIMPDINGFEVLVKLKESPDTGHIPVIIITGLSGEGDEGRGFLLGAVDYITKPFKSDIVRARVKTHIQIVGHIRTIEKLGLIDGLTDIPNRRNFDERINMEWRRALRDKRPLSFLMMDLDQFKAYNDTYGHPQGDLLLQTLAKILTGAVGRSTDFVARLGGEEFGMILPDTDYEGAMEMAEKIRSQVETARIPGDSGIITRVTISIGVVSAIPSDSITLQSFIAKADEYLYAAKKTGRNRIYSSKQ